MLYKVHQSVITQTDRQADRQTDIPVVYMLTTCRTIFRAYLSKLTMTSSVELELKVKKKALKVLMQRWNFS